MGDPINRQLIDIVILAREIQTIDLRNPAVGNYRPTSHWQIPSIDRKAAANDYGVGERVVCWTGLIVNDAESIDRNGTVYLNTRTDELPNIMNIHNSIHFLQRILRHDHSKFVAF